MNILLRIGVILIVVIAFSCNDNDNDNPMLSDNFDRTEMLEFWADQIIIPAYSQYYNSLQNLENNKEQFYSSASQLNLENLREAWLTAYLDWQTVSVFEIGKAEELGIRNFSNIYPANVELINSNILSTNYNLELPSNFSAQGFPALDYLLFGTGQSDNEIIDFLVDDSVQNYFDSLVSRLSILTNLVLTDWNYNYRSTFVSNNDSSATASTDKLVNDFLFYYEKFLRAGKVGIPAGVFSGNEEPSLVEGKYSAIYSKQLFEKGFFAARSFFNGSSFDGQINGPSLKQYLDQILNDNNGDFDIAEDIIMQWSSVDIALQDVSNDFGQQIIDDNSKMLALYDELQKAVVVLKVDMLQALNIQIDFVDADGD